MFSDALNIKTLFLKALCFGCNFTVIIELNSRTSGFSLIMDCNYQIFCSSKGHLLPSWKKAHTSRGWRVFARREGKHWLFYSPRLITWGRLIRPLINFVSVPLRMKNEPAEDRQGSTFLVGGWPSTFFLDSLYDMHYDPVNCESRKNDHKKPS